MLTRLCYQNLQNGNDFANRYHSIGVFIGFIGFNHTFVIIATYLGQKWPLWAWLLTMYFTQCRKWQLPLCDFLSYLANHNWWIHASDLETRLQQ